MTKTKEDPVTELEAHATEVQSDAPIENPTTVTETKHSIDDPDPATDAAPAVSETLLRELLAQVETGNTDMHRAELLVDLEARDGLLIHRREGMAEGIMTLEMAGVVVDFPDNQAPRFTLDNWCAAARRKIMSGELPA